MLSRYEQFSAAISCISRCIQKIERDEMVKYGCKGAYAQYLAALYRHPEGLTSAKLSEICDKDKAAVSRMVAEMEKKGLLLRQNSGDGSYRALLTLTPQGSEAASYVFQRGQAAVDLVGSCLTDSSRENLYHSLALIAENLETLSESGLPAEADTPNP